MVGLGSTSPVPALSPRPLRSHQRQLACVVEAIASGRTEARDILAAVTPGGGKSLLPVIAAARLIGAGIVDRVCWVVPRDSLRLQAEEAFADPVWRAALGHGLSVRAADNAPDPSRGLAGYVTTYQAIAAAPDLHLGEFRRDRTLLVVDEIHHLPALADTDPHAASEAARAGEDQASGWSRAILPLLECAAVRLLLSGTLERADGKGILWLPYRRGAKSDTREIELDAPGWAVIGYSRNQALQERAVLPVTFGALDGEARWRAEEGVEVGPHRLASPYPTETTRPALFTALRTGFAEALLRQAFLAVRELRARRREERGLAPGEAALGLGKLLVVAPDQENARRYLDIVRRWIPADQEAGVAQLATARATRVDPNAGLYETQRALVFHPDDPLFQRFRIRMETEQGTLARPPKPSGKQAPLPFWVLEQLAPPKDGIVPLESNALAMRFNTLRPGPDLAMRRPEQ